ncbi:cytochrome c biogenesis ATP-binding export protein CcmA [Agarivorans sp. Toyoura001]|uniref:cytochrome c biogenesis heme-transporting ATPase CcmA n=1 Tax=Agarivorans sp. Toyoura001 TaxID=2283141 RepID=UPI0010D08B80|nr:cytochrome c biogenesis heme-transporting ATPase CcmA [Agarivorans sp. Toyoura001]GDY24179.1 cytochrome c biogenesis ATP-binding export protein CcmA [Agarivorans sp. Toyoura001]
MLKASELCCVREERVLFDGLSFTLLPGEILQIAGPNGAGKTSLLRLIAGLSRPEGGEIFWQDHSISQDADSYHRDCLYLGHHAGVKAELSALENLRFYLGLAGQSLAQEQLYALLTRVGLAGLEEEPVAHLSAGQQRRVALARLWLVKRKLWILDEPFTAIDKQGVAYLEQVILEHAKSGGMVLLTTHQELNIAAERYRVLEIKPAFEEVV